MVMVCHHARGLQRAGLDVGARHPAGLLALPEPSQVRYPGTELVALVRGPLGAMARLATRAGDVATGRRHNS